MTGFGISGAKGFHMTFPNNVTVSVQFGGGNYCDNYDEPILSAPETAEYYAARGGCRSTNAEVAIMRGSRGDWFEWDGGRLTPCSSGGYVSNRTEPTEVLAILNAAAAIESEG